MLQDVARLYEAAPQQRARAPGDTDMAPSQRLERGDCRSCQVPQFTSRERAALVHECALPSRMTTSSRANSVTALAMASSRHRFRGGGRGGRGGGGGPQGEAAPPGEYRVTMTANGKTYTSKLRVREDPLLGTAR